MDGQGKGEGGVTEIPLGMSKECWGGAGEGTGGKALAAQANDLSSIPGVHGMEGENPLLLVVL